MPFGFTDYMRQEGKSESTLQDYRKILNQLFTFLDNELKSELEVYEITGRHLHSFLNVKRRHCSNSTLNKNISILKVFFDYLWRTNQIPIDPMTKIDYVKHEVSEPSFLYQDLLDIKPKIANDNQLSLLEKTLYILMLKGITFSELDVKKDDVKINGDKITLFVTGKNENQRVIELQGEDADIFYAYFERSLFLETPYVFVTRTTSESNTPVYVRIRYSRVSESFIHIREVDEKLNGLNLTTARNAYIYYLREDKQYSLDDIQMLLGLSKINVAKATESVVRRYQSIKG